MDTDELSLLIKSTEEKKSVSWGTEQDEEGWMEADSEQMEDI